MGQFDKHSGKRLETFFRYVRVDGMLDILHGLDPGDKVVSSYYV